MPPREYWFDVDGPLAACCGLSDALRPRLKGVERADFGRIRFPQMDAWAYDTGCILVRDGDAHHPWSPTARLGRRQWWPCDFGPELTRGFRALKVWFSLKQHGTRWFGQLMAQNCSQPQYLATRISAETELESLAPVSLNIVCFRCRKANVDDASLDHLNGEVVQDLHEAGAAAPSTTRVRGRLAIHVNITNYRCRREDLDLANVGRGPKTRRISGTSI